MHPTLSPTFKHRMLTLFAVCLLAATAAAQLPAVTLTDIDGNTLNIQELDNGGRPIVLSFWATWCKPCMREIKAIHEVYADWQDETGVKVILVSTDEAQDVQKVKPLVDGNGWDFDVLLDTNGELSRQMLVQMVPHVFVIDGNGRIVYNHSGYTDGSETELYNILKKL